MKSKKSKARQIAPATQSKLHLLSGNMCYNPNCRKQLISNDKKVLLSEIAHIEAASPNGARYNSTMTDDQRRHFDNLILLCGDCNKIIDNKENIEEFPVSLLKEWKYKRETEEWENKINSNKNLLGQAIDALSEINIEDNLIENNVEVNDGFKPFNIENKISYNNLQAKKPIIDEYKKYYGRVNKIYDEIEKQGSFKKSKLLEIIRLKYLKIKGKYLKDNPSLSEINVIKTFSDSIYSEVEEELSENMYSRKNPDDIQLVIPIIMTDAFMRCKILEEPPSEQ